MRLLRTKLSRWKVGELFFLLYCLIFMTNIVLSASSQNEDKCPSICFCDKTIGVVNCSGKGLKEIPAGIPSWVKQLLLQNNRIYANGISSFDFSRFHLLEELDLSENKLLNFSGDFTGIQSLRKISLEHCSLSTLPHIKTESNITHLLLSHNLISDASNNLRSYSTLQHLDLSFNRFRQIKSGVFINQRSLKYLNLQKNRISSLAWSSFSGLLSIDTLDLSRNKIRNIVSVESSKPSTNQDSCEEDNEGIDQVIQPRNLQSLKSLNLSHNILTHVDGLTFSGMCSLEILVIDHNRISRLGDGAFYGPTALKTLILDYNHISSIKKGWLFKLEALKTLSVAHNNLTVVETDGWKFCTELVHLDLSHNRVTSLPSHGFSKLSKLESFQMTDNQIAFLEDDAFDGLGQLLSLDLSNNVISSSIEDIDGAFRGLDSIQFLSLRGNRIRSLSASTFEGIKIIVTLDLRHNDVTSIQNHTFDGMTNLKSLRIISSSFLCDCQLAWFPTWLKSMERSHQEFQYSVDGSCFHPPALKGRDILNISSEEFVCVAHPIPKLLCEPMSSTALIGDNITLECCASATYTDMLNETVTSSQSSVPPQAEEEQSVGANLQGSRNPLHNSRIPLKDSTFVAPPLQTLPKPGESRSRLGGFPLKADEPSKAPEKKKTPPQRRSAERIDLDKNGMTVTWKRGQEILQPGSGIEIRNITRQKDGYAYVSSLLVMKGVTADETGKYNCIISNNYGYARSKPAEIVVNEYPRFTKTPVNFTIVHNGSSVVLNCAATGQPPPQIQWQKVNEDGSKDFPAATDRRLRRKQTNLLKPQLLNKPDTSDFKGEEGMFLKPSDGENSESDVKKTNEKFEVDPDAPLDFAVVLPVDAGEYECVAESSVGRIVTKAMLIVEMAPSFPKPLPEKSESSVGASTVIQCIVDAQPDPEIHWSFNGAALSLSERHYLVKNGQMLIITSAEKTDAGVYTCAVSNKHGAVSHRMTLKIIGGGSDFFSSLMNGEFSLWAVVIAIAVAVIISVVITALLCHFLSKKKQDKASSLTTGTTDLERAPLDENSLVSTDESVRKGQSSQSIHLPGYEMNASRAPVEQDSRLTYGVSASTSDITLLQIQSPGAASTAPLFQDRLESRPLVKRSHSSTAIQWNQIAISRFRSAEDFKSEESHPMYEISTKRNGRSRGGPSAKPITSPSAAFAKKAAGEDNYVPITLKTHRSCITTPSNGLTSKEPPSSGCGISTTKPPGGQTSTTVPSSGRSSTTTPPGGRSSKTTPTGSRTSVPRTSSDRNSAKEQNSSKKTKRSKKSKGQPHNKEQCSPKGKMPTSNGKLPNSRKMGVAGTHPHYGQTNNYNHIRQCNDKDSFARAQVHEPLDRRKYVLCSDTNQTLGGDAPNRNQPIHKTSSSSSGPVDFSSNTTLASESSSLLHRSDKEEGSCPSPPSSHEREQLLSCRVDEESKIR